MNKRIFCFLPILVLLTGSEAASQPVDALTLYSRHTLQAERIKRREGVYTYTILPLLNQQPDTTNEQSFQSALWSISQYMLKNDTARRIIDTLFGHYHQLESSTRRSLMEVVYGLYPSQYTASVQQLWPQENDDRLLALMIAYLRRSNPEGIDEKQVRQKLTANKNQYDSSAVLQRALQYGLPGQNEVYPPVPDLFRHQQVLGVKVIYSLQRTNRNFPGIAIIQQADGSFVKDSSGRLKTFVQLARSAADLPYFITNGSTPQGAYRIRGTAVSRNNFIGPTPNIQLRMPYEIVGDSFFIHPGRPVADDPAFLQEYLELFPAAWRNEAMMESYYAGKCGRAAIIAHGTTIDPWFYQQQPFYPCTPTLGCLCAREIWNPGTGRLVQSDQLDMVNTFFSSTGSDGYLYVINVGNEKRAVTPEEATALVNTFETKR